jgi:hypothetical protein
MTGDGEQRVARYLTSRPGIDVCDSCLAARVSVTVDEARRIADRLGQTSPYRREFWKCSDCGTRGVVTSGLAKPVPGGSTLIR